MCSRSGWRSGRTTGGATLSMFQGTQCILYLSFSLSFFLSLTLSLSFSPSIFDNLSILRTTLSIYHGRQYPSLSFPPSIFDNLSFLRTIRISLSSYHDIQFLSLSFFLSFTPFFFIERVGYRIRENGYRKGNYVDD